MRTFLVSSESYSAFQFLPAAPSNSINYPLLISDPSKTICHLHQSFSTTASPKLWSFKFRPFLYCTSRSDSPALGGDEEDQDTANFANYANDVDGDEDDDVISSGKLLLVDDEVGESESIAEDGVYIEVNKLEKNSRRIQSRISIDAPLSTVWSILTDYERLAEFIPGLAVSQLLDKGDNYARLFQIGQQNLAFGLKFNAKGVVDCYEKELESLSAGMRREIEFKMVEGDFQLFEGKWSILESNSGSCEEAEFRESNTTLSYIVDVKPKLWLPVRLIEGRLCSEIKMNLASIRKEAQKSSWRAIHAH